MRKIVINRCFGGFNLSPYAVKRIAELQGRECYFFASEGPEGAFAARNIEELDNWILWYAFDTQNLSFMHLKEKEWSEMSEREREEYDKEVQGHYLDNRNMKRDDPLLVKVVEKLGEKANGMCAKLAIVEIPNDVEWTIEVYNGNEHIAEKHRTWG